jgi:hypothetical protein
MTISNNKTKFIIRPVITLFKTYRLEVIKNNEHTESMDFFFLSSALRAKKHLEGKIYE